MNLKELSNVYYKLAIASGDVFVYHFVRPDSIQYVKKHGLLSGKLLVEKPELLEIARPNKKDQERFKKSVEEDLQNEDDKIVSEGISVFFTLPDFSKIPKDHFIYKWNLVPLKINLSSIVKDNKDTKLFGVELKPWNDRISDDKNTKQREKFLNLNEVKEYTEKKPSEIWKYYSGKDKKRYAPDVPHLIVRTNKYKILPKYILI
jgi:hypothetical protein